MTDALVLAYQMFLLLDPLGNVPVFAALLSAYSPQRQRAIIFREMCIALLIILAFLYLGDWILGGLGVKPYTVMMSGGIILFLIAIKMVFPPPKEEQQALSKEPFIVPMAIPLVAGPAVLAGVMIYARQASSEWLLIGGVTLAWLVSTVILLAASFLKRVLGERGLFACERLMGLLLVLIAVQMFLNGIALYCAPSL